MPPREHGCLEVVTAGVVLQRLQRDPALLSVSHLLLDEVHERDTTVDILLGVVKQVCVSGSLYQIAIHLPYTGK